MRHLCGPNLLLIGVGGVDNAKRAQMIQAGADLIQIYTGLVIKVRVSWEHSLGLQPAGALFYSFGSLMTILVGLIGEFLQ